MRLNKKKIKPDYNVLFDAPKAAKFYKKKEILKFERQIKNLKLSIKLF